MVVSVAVVSMAAPVSIGAGAGAGAIVAVSAGTSPSSSAFAHAVATNAKAIMLAIPNLRIRTFLIREIRVFALIGNIKLPRPTCQPDYMPLPPPARLVQSLAQWGKVAPSPESVRARERESVKA